MTNTFAIVVSDFNESFTTPLLNHCLKGFSEQGIEPIVLKVPGALEIPIGIQDLILKFKPSAIVALGVLIKGDTDHYSAICTMVQDGVMQVSLKHHVPVIFEVLMADHEDKIKSRLEKGYHAAYMAVKMQKLLSSNLSSSKTTL